ncbi:unnamed protein product [Phyllotreta striolata]|uniref:Uncharacterized protein n=1 Tax=Phyllotreta striolata TaxID=444603 RepID=A0A9N9THQ6_PHYSR|nr:unnamed protein product [Phyllotreta striolata]
MAGYDLGDAEKTIKCLSLPAALIGTIQSAAWLILSLISILYYNDAIELSSSIDASSYGFIIYYLYLSSKDGTNKELIISPHVFNIIMYFYLVLSLVWFLMSVYLFWATIRNKWNRILQIVLAWSALTLLLCAIDITFTSVLASDLHTAQDLFASSTSTIKPVSDPNLLGEFDIDDLNNEQFNTEESTTDESTTEKIARLYFTASAYDGDSKDFLTSIGIVMSIAARGYILWIVNLTISIILSIAFYKYKSTTRPSLMQRNIINAFETGNRPFSMYDQVEIDKSFQNEAFEPDNNSIFSPRSNDFSFTNVSNQNPLSNSNRSSVTYINTPNYSFERNIQPNGERLAKIGKSGGRRTPPRKIPSPTVPNKRTITPQQIVHQPTTPFSNMPYIPEPDYTPPASPKSQPKGVLKRGKDYQEFEPTNFLGSHTFSEGKEELRHPDFRY